MNNVLVDTSVLIEAQKKQSIFLDLKELQDKVCISRAVACEVIYGSRDNQEKKRNHSLISFLPILEISEPISKLAFSLIDTYSVKCSLSIGDAFIAATALHHDLPLWTLNKKHFREIKKLKLFELN